MVGTRSICLLSRRRVVGEEEGVVRISQLVRDQSTELETRTTRKGISFQWCQNLSSWLELDVYFV